jgi:hypothetical protein
LGKFKLAFKIIKSGNYAGLMEKFTYVDTSNIDGGFSVEIPERRTPDKNLQARPD